MIPELLPQAEQGLAHGAPAFRLDGRVVAGCSAARGHLSDLPRRGTGDLIAARRREIDGG